MDFLTIGYGGRTPEDLLDILVQHAVRAVADVRLRPDRASMGSYTLAKSPEKGLRALLQRKEILYFSLPELGNVFLDLPDWQTRYAKLMALAGDLLTERLYSLPTPLCLLCAEKHIDKCHRKHIADFLVRLGHKVEHIDGQESRSSGPRTARVRSALPPWVYVDTVPGFGHYRGVLPGDWQDELVRSVDAAEDLWEPDFSRFRQCYGYRYIYEGDTLSQIGDGSLPRWLRRCAEFICAQGWMSSPAQQVTVQKYGAGSFIGPHRDSGRCFGEVATFSLVSGADLRLAALRDRVRLVRRLEPGDVVVLQGDARSKWKHEILKRGGVGSDWRRLSITFRTIKPERVR